MFPLETLLLVSLVMLAIGGAIGFVLAKSSSSQERQKELEERLSSSKEELDSYQQEVAKHFMETSKKVTDLTQSYRDLHEHLAKGALTLANNEIGREMLQAADTKIDDKSLESTSVEAPKDWAPKEPGSKGMLSEDFGLREAEATASVPHHPPRKDSDKSA